MEEIIKKANELGLMIKGTEIFKRFDELTKKLEADEESKTLMDEYVKLNNDLYEKEKNGSVIEVSEKKRLQEIGDRVSRNNLIKEYIATQTYYLNLIIQVQKALNEPEGEPIAESKIITPGGSGKIVTDF